MDQKMGMVVLAIICGIILLVLLLRKRAQIILNFLVRTVLGAIMILLVNDILQGYLKGQTKINLDLHASHELERLLRRLVRNVVMGLWVMALLISSSIICTTNMTPKIWGIPALGAFGYLMAFGIVMYVFLKHIFSGK